MRQLFSGIALAAVLFTSCQHTTVEKEEETKYLVTNPIKKDTLIFNQYVSQIHSIQHIELRALEKGYLQNIYVDEGQFVQKGKLMFQIFPVIYQAEMQKAQAEVSFAEIEYQNTKNLADSNIVSKNELAMAKATLTKAKAELSLAQAHLDFTEIKAPFDGIVGRFNDVRLGSLVDEGDLITTLSDNSNMWVYFNVPEAEYLNYATQIKSDTPLKVNLLMANNEQYNLQGTVETIEADFNNETGNIAFRATFPNPNKLLRHGETGNILMPLYLNTALIIPQKATFEILDKKFVFVVDSDNVVKTRQITVSTEMPHLFVVTSGLKTTDRIIVEGLRKVKNNDKVETKFISFQDVVSDSNHLHAE